ncbi:MAG: NAD(P)-binding domain-containing protein [Micropruina sp.]|uniref:NAD(P)-binding domain-containing protein n=1 Tax=Micropruina sp. TaxID=2737536 RepID=UPI0039E45CCD
MTDQKFSADYAVLGVGSIAEAIVTGLCDGVDAPPRVVLSPRSRKRSARLAERYPTVRVAADNQQAASSAATVLLCLRPQDAEAALASIRLDQRQRVVSAMASFSSEHLAQLIGPVAEISRAIPAAAVAERSSVTPLYPPGSAAQQLFDGLGGSMPLASENLLDATSVASATVAAHLAYLETISVWLAGQGVELDDAQRLLASVFAGATAGFAHSTDFTALARQHATPGGLNEHLVDALRAAGLYDTVAHCLDDMLAHLSTS